MVDTGFLLYYTLLYCTISYPSPVLISVCNHFTVLYFTLLCCTIMYCIVLYCIVWCTLLYCVLHCMVTYCTDERELERGRKESQRWMMDECMLTLVTQCWEKKYKRNEEKREGRKEKKIKETKIKNKLIKKIIC